MSSLSSLARPLLALVLASTACAETPGAKVAADVETMRSEQSASKLFERGRAFASVGDLTRAEQYLAAALEAGAPPRVVLPLLLRVCIAERRLRVAIDYVEPILRREPGDDRLRLVVASLYASIGDSGAARHQLETVLRKQPDNAEAHYMLAFILRNDTGDAVAADRHFREYLRIKPSGAHAAEARSGLMEMAP